MPGAWSDTRTMAAADGKSAVSPEEIQSARDRIASRGAQAAVALLRLGQDDNVWRLLEYSPDPRLRSAFIHILPILGSDPALLVQALEGLADEPPKAGPASKKDAYLFDPVTSSRRALVQALAGYPRNALGPAEQDALVARFARIYRDDPDAGVHSAAGLVLSRWGFQDLLKVEPRRPPRAGEPITQRWYDSPAGQTMVLIDGPVEFEMGSPPSDPDRTEIEVLHRRIIPRRFAIASREVSFLQFAPFAKEKGVSPLKPPGNPKPDLTRPQIGVTWFIAANYCNWLSDREGLLHCYVPKDKDQFAAGMTVDERAV